VFNSANPEVSKLTSTMAWQRLDRRRQAALPLKLLVVLLFAVSSLNFFIPWRLSTDERQAHDVFSSADNSKQIIIF
jgi:hypothetical protein